MSELTVILATGFVILYAILDWWLVTPRYFTPIYIAASVLATFGLTF